MTAPTEDAFARLLRAMSQIAETVNRFTSTDVQRLAFEELMELYDAAADVADLGEPEQDDSLPRCLGQNKRGYRCHQRPSPGTDYCWRHDPERSVS